MIIQEQIKDYISDQPEINAMIKRISIVNISFIVSRIFHDKYLTMYYLYYTKNFKTYFYHKSRCFKYLNYGYYS
ncbi:catabolite regulation protein CreA [Chryseobacterium sp. PvR013]|nr:catabolite regulation protein CreA [Chryseobacterium sp. PvR013]